MKRMNYRTLILTALSIILLVPGAVFPNEMTEVWGTIYRNAPSLQQKYAVMLNIIELDYRDMVPLLIEALDELNNQRIEYNKQEAVIQDDLKFLIISELGNLKAGEAGPYIYRAMKETDDPFLKSESISALGKIGAKTYAHEISLILKNLTLSRGNDSRGAEAIAFGCIVALERLKEPVGYIQVFYAMDAGFSRRINELGKRALQNILEDPSEILNDILINESELKIKLNALKAVDYSKAPAERKNVVAHTALDQGLSIQPMDIKGKSYLRELRMLALEMFIKNKGDNGESVKLIEKLFYINTDTTEKISSLEVLRIMSNDEAANALNRYLAHQNRRQESGVSNRSNRIVIATIRAIGSANSNVGTNELLRTKFSGYPSSVVREADKAIKALE